jgi:hypothetical protein
VSTVVTDVEMVYPELGGPRRAILLGAMTSAWYEASDEERERILPRFKQLMDEWQELGARMLATLDDDLYMVGEPGSPSFTFYLLFEVPHPDTVVAMIQRIRESVGGVRMERYVRFEAHVGRPFFLLEAS